ncbi:MAG: hypothetical protein ABGZ35_07390 [Planctomycetaceae bacterium]|jgi:hypothetical protein
MSSGISAAATNQRNTLSANDVSAFMRQILRDESSQLFESTRLFLGAMIALLGYIISTSVTG